MQKIANKLSSLKNHALSLREREAMRERVLSFMKTSPLPVRNENMVRHHLGEARNKSLVAVTKLKRKRMISIIVAVLFGLSGGVSYAAQGSLPGDTLYPVKVHVNEGVEGAFQVGAKAEAEFARKELERRAAETEALAAQERLDVNAKATLTAQTQAHLNAFAEAKQNLEADGATTTAREEQAKTDHALKANADAFLKLGISVNGDAETGVEGASAHSEESASANGSVSSGVNIKLPVKASTTLKMRAHSLLESILGNDDATGSVKSESDATVVHGGSTANTTSTTSTSAHSEKGNKTATGSVDAEIHVNADGTIDAAPISLSGSAGVSAGATTNVAPTAAVTLPAAI